MMTYPQRIISIVPSQTELLADLGLGDRVVGITKFCVHPTEWFREKTRVGGTKTVNIAKALALHPDLIIANKEENDREQVEALSKYCPVYTSDVKTLEDALEMIGQVGKLTGTEEKAADLSQRIQAHFFLPDISLKRAAYLIWRKPYMVAGGDTFIHDMLPYAGFSNVFGDKKRYPECNALELAEANPEYILLSSEPFPFKEKHVAELAEICPNAVIQMVDGEMYSWYGSRLLQFILPVRLP
jgi:ABC-type Fe3+-hydroxamate transport system substrate-binding protein